MELTEILNKISDNTVTCEDFNRLISESMPESIRDRVRRRTLRSPAKSHTSHSGHQQLSLPQFSKRISPKREPSNQQNHGRSRSAHNKSTRTQRRRSNKFDEEIQFISLNIGKPLIECDLSNINSANLRLLIPSLMTLPNINRDWLHDLHVHIGELSNE